MSEYFKRTVEAGYDRTAERSLATKDPEDPATLAALGAREGWGASMRWGHYHGETSFALLRGAGFAVERAEVRTTSGDESWLWVLARKGG